MKLKSFLSFKPKLPKPNCSIFVLNPKKQRCFSLKGPRFKRRRFRAKFKKPFSVKALRFPKCHRFNDPNLKFKKPRRRIRFRKKNPVPDSDRFGEKVSELVSVFRSTRGSRELDRVMDHHPMTSTEKTEQPDSVTPPVADVDKAGPGDDVCRSFENYVAEMIVEEGKLKDLMDVEEMLYCWRSLKSPVFVDLVCRFYGEMCTDLFSVEEEEEGKITPSTTTTTSTSE